MTKIYIVENPSEYYPQPGVSDWVLVTRNHSRALVCLSNLISQGKEEWTGTEPGMIIIDTDDLPLRGPAHPQGPGPANPLAD
jgi:hypothetical protein